MHILITGAAGMLGRRFVQQVLADGRLGARPVQRLTLTDVVMPQVPAALRARCPSVRIDAQCQDLMAGPALQAQIAARPDLVIHLAAVVSGEAEADFDKGYRVNLDGSRDLFETIRREANRPDRAPGWCPRVVMTSSIAVYGRPFPDVIDDHWHLTPLTSYGTQKAIAELLLADYSRRGFLDGIALRLPTVCIRPGAPNKAASGFFSSILREPLAGLPVVLPVSEDVEHWHVSPGRAVDFLFHAATLDLQVLGAQRALNMPGLRARVADQIEALRRVAGQGAVTLIRHEPDAAIERIVAGWPCAFDPQRALALGFVADTDFDTIIRQHIEDEASDLA